MPLHVLYTFPLRIGVPGIGMTAWHQVAGLAELGVHVTLCCGTCERPIPGVGRVIETMKFAGVRIPYRLTGLMRGIRHHDAQTARLLRREKVGIDVVHGWPLGSLNTLRAAQELGIPSVLERQNAHTSVACDIVAKEHAKLGIPLDRSNSHANNPHRLAVEEAEYRLATRLACPSDFVARSFIERGFSPAQIARHQYGYDPTRFKPNGHGSGDRPFTVAFVGRCEPRKGLHYALQAWHASGAAETGHFIICGSYAPRYRQWIEPLLRHPSIKERGFVDDIATVLSEADVLVLPSIEEGSALVTYEARGAGCVLLASDAAGAVGTDGEDLMLHTARDVSVLAGQMRELSTNRARLEQLRRQSLSRTATLTWTHAARVLLDEYTRALSDVRAAMLTQST